MTDFRLSYETRGSNMIIKPLHSRLKYAVVLMYILIFTSLFLGDWP